MFVPENKDLKEFHRKFPHKLWTGSRYPAEIFSWKWSQMIQITVRNAEIFDEFYVTALLAGYANKMEQHLLLSQKLKSFCWNVHSNYTVTLKPHGNQSLGKYVQNVEMVLKKKNLTNKLEFIHYVQES